MAICLETIDVCIWHMLVIMSAVLTVWECLLCSGHCCCLPRPGPSVKVPVVEVAKRTN